MLILVKLSKNNVVNILVVLYNKRNDTVNYWSLIKLCNVICKPYSSICMHLWRKKLLFQQIWQWPNTTQLVSHVGMILITVSRVKGCFPPLIPFFSVLITSDTTPMAIEVKIYLYLIKQFPASCCAVSHRWEFAHFYIKWIRSKSVPGGWCTVRLIYFC